MRITVNGHGARELPQFEVVLITRVIETSNIRAAIKRKVTEDFFVLPDTRAAWSYLVGHYQEYGATPSIELFREKFPEFDLHSTQDPVEVVCDHLRNNKLQRDLYEGLEEIVRHTGDNPSLALEQMRTMTATLTTQFVLTRDMDITHTVEEIKAEYKRVKEGQGMLGIPWPWPKLNETTLGIQNEELIFFYGRPKSTKSWMMIETAVHAFRRGRRVLFITLEMPTHQIRRRAAALWSRVSYKGVRAGTLPPAEEQRYFDDLDALSEIEGFILSGVDENKGVGTTALAAKIDEYDPDIVFVDGVYLMRDDRANKRGSDWQSIAHITQDLKALVKRTQLPLLGSTQANRSGDKTKGQSLNEMAFGDAFVMDADYVIRVIRDQKEKDDNEAVLTLPGIRESEGCTFTINTFFAENLSQKSVAESQEEIDTLLAGTDEGAEIIR